ncbi:SRPBCC family protein [Nonomuraea sediminis]|uniref:SRPBCC family protein n=1 Tax=Nonomuraea sediminis TaxID=2835864 RepID=UPI001BDC40E7|nr:SRPBCC domain-containing protein [Nonomuraea sediminis]
MTNATAVRLERVIAAPPERVYRAWLDPELVRQWLAPQGMSVTRVEIDRSRYSIWHGDAGGFECEVLEQEQDRRIVFRWGFAGPDRIEGPVFDSLLTITVNPAPGGGTELTLVHEQLEELAAALPEIAANVGVGWAGTLDKLAAVAEAGA